MRSFTLSPISLHHDFVLSLSRSGGQLALCKVVASNFLIYVFNISESNLDRGGTKGDEASERETVGGGERTS